MANRFFQGFDKPDSADSAAPPGGSQVNVDDTASAGIVAERKQKRQRRTTATDASSSLTPEDQKALEATFDPKQWRGLVRAPADAAQMLTGSRMWELSQEEVDTMAVGASTCARHFVKTDAKWIALMLFSLSTLSIYGAHYVAYKQEQNILSKKKPAEPTDNKQPTGDAQ